MSRAVVALLIVLLLFPLATQSHQRRGGGYSGGGYSNRDIGLAIFSGILDYAIRNARNQRNRKAYRPNKQPYPRKPLTPNNKPKLPDPDVFPDDFNTGDNPFGNLDPAFSWSGGDKNSDYRYNRAQYTMPKSGGDEARPPGIEDIDWNDPKAFIRANEYLADKAGFEAGVIAGIENTLKFLDLAGKGAQLGLGFSSAPLSMGAQAAMTGIGSFGQQASSALADGKGVWEATKQGLTKAGLDVGIGLFGGTAFGGGAKGLENGFGNAVGMAISEGSGKLTSNIASGSTQRSFKPSPSYSSVGVGGMQK